MFEKIIFPIVCTNNYDLRQPKVEVSLQDENSAPKRHEVFDSLEVITESQLNQSTSNIRKNIERPHYYHVVCQDLIFEMR